MHNHQHQQTIAQSVSFVGRALHTGEKCRVVLYPSPPDSGIVFKRIDKNDAIIPATFAHAEKRFRSSGPVKDGVTVRTCEHLLAALYACDVDNVLVEMDREEVPILDGSSAPFVKIIEQAGLVVQNARRKIIKVTKTMESRQEDRFIRIEPPNELFIDLSFTLREFGRIFWTSPLDRKNFKKEITPARTVAPFRHALPMKLLAMLTGNELRLD